MPGTIRSCRRRRKIKTEAEEWTVTPSHSKCSNRARDILRVFVLFGDGYIGCEHNRNRYYVPEWLLEEWSITVDPTFSDAA